MYTKCQIKKINNTEEPNKTKTTTVEHMKTHIHTIYDVHTNTCTQTTVTDYDIYYNCSERHVRTHTQIQRRQNQYTDTFLIYSKEKKFHKWNRT